MNGSMASACATPSNPLVSRTLPSACPSSKKTTAAASLFRRRRRTVSSSATGGGRCDDNDALRLWLPRRDVILKGGVAAAGFAWYPGLASGAPPKPPVSQCETGADKVSEKVLLCSEPTTLPCPVRSEMDPVDFNPSVTRVRQPVHLLSPEYQEKYREAVGKMKALQESNPLSFKAQAAVHQAYCDSYYKYHKSAAASKDDPTFDVHFSWIFAPWHRMYIYFYERALGQLIGDDTFALPYWSWDAPAGMVVPPLFRDEKWTRPDGTKVVNPLYDPNRNQANLDKLIDLDNAKNKDTPRFEGSKEDEKYMELVNKNLCTVYIQQQVKLGVKKPLLFLGEKYCTNIGITGSRSSAGTLEQMAHTAVHIWVGKSGPPPGKTCSPETGGVLNHSSKTPGDYICRNDMGFLGSAGNDPLFYSHHSNVDRMWHLWSAAGGQGFDDPDWLDSSFVFYDNVRSPRKVRIKVRDVLDTTKLGYTYAESGKDLPWLEPKITPLVDRSATAPRMKTKKLLVRPRRDLTKEDEQLSSSPLTLVQDQVVEVPDVAVPAKEKGKEQVLVIDGIEFDPQANNKFDVAINVPKDKALRVGPQYKEYAGSFAVVPGSGGGATRMGKVSLCITDVLADIGAAGDSTVDVVIVPRTQAKVTLNARPTIQNRK